jgi:hypothetical protein
MAHIRHAETDYDNLLAHGVDRQDARFQVSDDVDRVLARWQG